MTIKVLSNFTVWCPQSQNLESSSSLESVIILLLEPGDSFSPLTRAEMPSCVCSHGGESLSTLMDGMDIFLVAASFTIPEEQEAV